MMFSKFIFFIFDYIILILTLPISIFLILLFIVIIYLIDGRPIFFYQERAGFEGKPFNLIKIRTMKNQKHIRLGKTIRKFKLDEIPQLLNVLKGDISFVGPRPLYVRYIKLYNNEQMLRLGIKPGLTGLAQVKGGNLLKWNERFKLDKYYIENRSFFFDIYIIFLTFICLIKSLIVSDHFFNMTDSEDFNGKN